MVSHVRVDLIVALTDSQARPNRSLSVVTITFVAWALWAVVLSSYHLIGLFESRNAITCSDRRDVFSPEHGADPLSYHLFDDGRLAIIEIGEFFPFVVRSTMEGVPKSNTLRFVDRSSNSTVSALTPTIDGRWSWIGRVFAWSDRLLVWTVIERSDPVTRNPVRSYRRFLTDGEIETELADNAAFKPLAVDFPHQLVASIEERQRVMGGQPKEYELPPQTVRIESLASPEPRTVATFPVRRALRFFFEDGALMVLRWEPGTAPSGYSEGFRMFLDRHDLPNYTTTWTTELTPQPTSQGYGAIGPTFNVAKAQPIGTFALRYLDYVDGFVARHVKVDTTSGEILASSIQADTSDVTGRSLSRGDEIIWRMQQIRRCAYEAPAVD